MKICDRERCTRVYFFSGPSGSLTPMHLVMRIEYRLKAGALAVRDVALFIISREQAN